MTADSEPPVSVRLPGSGTTVAGPVVDLRGRDAAPSIRAIRGAILAGEPSPADVPTVSAPTPGPAYAHVSALRPDGSIERRAALAAAARSRGIETAHDAALVAASRELRAVTPPPVDAAALRDARRRAADAGAETERLRERVATVRGRVTALREAVADGSGASPDAALAAAESALADATRRLSEVSTERVAAAQRLRLLEARAREARDRRDERLRLEDRIGNLERAVRDRLVAAVEPDVREARRTVDRRLGATASADLRDALAVGRVASIRAPVVVAGGVADALGGPDATADFLDAPVVIR
ncbi:MAG: hypothetical protein ABEK02_09090 [Haloquadratum sp.]